MTTRAARHETRGKERRTTSGPGWDGMPRLGLASTGAAGRPSGRARRRERERESRADVPSEKMIAVEKEGEKAKGATRATSLW